MNTVTPRLGAGLKDYLPAEMIVRQRMLDTIRSVFERFGFVPLDTPCIELEDVLTGGDPDFNKQIFRTGLRGGSEGLALRFDLTVALARVVAQYRDRIPRPFKRYQIGKVFRGEKPQAGRFREFVQFDADIVGCADPIADAEIIALIFETISALGVGDFTVKVNNRKVLNGLPDFVGFPTADMTAVLRLIDKIENLGWDNVSGELKDQHSFGPDQLTRLKDFLDFRGGGQRETVAGIRKLMAGSAVAMDGLDELDVIIRDVEALGVPAGRWTIDLSVARGLGYYTGPVFETVLDSLPSIGSVFSGGRFDDLVSRFSSLNVPATGASVGVDRLFAAMNQLGLVKSRGTLTQILILNFDPACRTLVQNVATSLRRWDMPTEIYMGKEKGLKGQLSAGVRDGVPVVVIIGASEMAEGTAVVKDMVARRQFKVPVAEVVVKAREILGCLQLTT